MLSVCIFVFLNKKTSNKTCNGLAEGSYELAFESNGGTQFSTLKVCVTCDSETYEQLPTPKKEKNVFLGWYLDEDLTNPISSNNVADIKPIKVLDNKGCTIGYKKIVLYAKWEQLSEEVNNNKSITNDVNNTNNNNNNTSNANTKKYYCENSSYNLVGTMCIKNITINATVNDTCPKGYVYGGKGICYNESGKTSISSLRCEAGAAGPDSDGMCYKNLNDYGFNQCKSNGNFWYNNHCYENLADTLCPNGKTVDEITYGYGQSTPRYYCSMYFDGKPRTVSSTKTYSCPKGYNISGKYCKKQIKVKAIIK